MTFTFFNCGAVVEASDFFVSIHGRWDDVTSDAGAVWMPVRKTLASYQVPVPDE